LTASLERIVAALSTARFTVSNEEALQRGVAVQLEAAAPGMFAREQRLSQRDRPDFFALAIGIVVEVKWGRSGGSDTSVYRQLARYAEDPRVRAIVFATPSRRVASAIPDLVGSVPVRRVVLHTGL
jgi:hypothetical protein